MNKLTRGVVLAGALYSGANAFNTPEAYAHHSSFEQTCNDATVTFEDMAGHPYLKSNMPSVMVDNVVVVTLTQDEINQGKIVKNIDIKQTNKSVKTSWVVDWNNNNTLDAGETYGATYPLTFDDCETEPPVTTTTQPTPTTTQPVPTTTITQVELAPPQEPVINEPQEPVVSIPDMPEKELARTGGLNEPALRAGVLLASLGLCSEIASRRYRRSLQKKSNQ